jgi:hypothetical protein
MPLTLLVTSKSLFSKEAQLIPRFSLHMRTHVLLGSSFPLSKILLLLGEMSAKTRNNLPKSLQGEDILVAKVN